MFYYRWGGRNKNSTLLTKVIIYIYCRWSAIENIMMESIVFALSREQHKDGFEGRRASTEAIEVIVQSWLRNAIEA